MAKLSFTINDNTLVPEKRRREVKVAGSQAEIDHLVSEGYLLIDGIFERAQLQSLGEALDRVVARETHDPATEHLAGNGHYVRDLLNKDTAFHSLLAMHKPLAISRVVLGPQVWFDAEARVVPAGIAGLRVNWHIHHRVIPDPMPPFFSYPHAIHGLLYLDDVDDDNGPICLLPRSHASPHLSFPTGSQQDREGQVLLPVRAGACLLAHANLWHRTIPTTANARRRRVILFGYTPAWIKSDVARGVKADRALTDTLREQGDDETRELLGGFVW